MLRNYPSPPFPLKHFAPPPPQMCCIIYYRQPLLLTCKIYSNDTTVVYSKSWLKHFFRPFLAFFSDFTPEINKKRLKMNKKTWFCLLLKAGRHAKAGRLLEGVPQNCLIDTEIRNMIIFPFFKLFTVKNVKKHICAAPKRWLKNSAKNIQKVCLMQRQIFFCKKNSKSVNTIREELERIFCKVVCYFSRGPYYYERADFRTV